MLEAEVTGQHLVKEPAASLWGPRCLARQTQQGMGSTATFPRFNTTARSASKTRADTPAGGPTASLSGLRCFGGPLAGGSAAPLKPRPRRLLAAASAAAPASLFDRCGGRLRPFPSAGTIRLVAACNVLQALLMRALQA